MSASQPILNALTVDVEDYFHVQAFADVINPESWDRYESRVEANTSRILDLFAEYDVKGTFFILGWEAERRPNMVKRIASEGHEIACHGHGHQLIYRIGTDAFREDVRRSKAVLQDITGKAVVGYRAPSYSITAKSLWALDILAEEGFSYDSSIVPARHDFYGLPGAPRFPYRNQTASGELMEFPPSTIRVGVGDLSVSLPVGGGGYLRLYPLRLTRWGLKRINRSEGQPFSTYVHPWEIDPDQPRLDAPVKSRFRHYNNLRQTGLRLSALLGEFAFAPMGQVLTSLSNLPKFMVAEGTVKEAA